MRGLSHPDLSIFAIAAAVWFACFGYIAIDSRIRRKRKRQEPGPQLGKPARPPAPRHPPRITLRDSDGKVLISVASIPRVRELDRKLRQRCRTIEVRLDENDEEAAVQAAEQAAWAIGQFVALKRNFTGLYRFAAKRLRRLDLRADALAAELAALRADVRAVEEHLTAPEVAGRAWRVGVDIGAVPDRGALVVHQGPGSTLTIQQPPIPPLMMVPAPAAPCSPWSVPVPTDAQMGELRAAPRRLDLGSGPLASRPIIAALAPDEPTPAPEPPPLHEGQWVRLLQVNDNPSSFPAGSIVQVEYAGSGYYDIARDGREDIFRYPAKDLEPVPDDVLAAWGDAIPAFYSGSWEATRPELDGPATPADHAPFHVGQWVKVVKDVCSCAYFFPPGSLCECFQPGSVVQLSFSYGDGDQFWEGCRGDHLKVFLLHELEPIPPETIASWGDAEPPLTL